MRRLKEIYGGIHKSFDCCEEFQTAWDDTIGEEIVS